MILCHNVFARRCNKQSFPDCLAVLGFVLDLHVNNYRFHFFFSEVTILWLEEVLGCLRKRCSQLF